MTWEYAELAKEACKRGGPAALRYFYRAQGVVIGAAITGAGVAGPKLYNKWRARSADTGAAPAPESSATAPNPGDTPEPRGT